MAELQKFRIHLIYIADGMTRPLSFRSAVPAVSCAEALHHTTRFIETAYDSGFKVLTWTCENLSKPVEVKYVGGAFADEVTEEQEQEQEEEGEPAIKPVTGFDLYVLKEYSGDAKS
jgi:hypothetical protein